MNNIEVKGKELGIVYVNEKKWIMAYFYKTHNYKFKMFKNQFLRLWDVWWHSDFSWKDDGLRIRVSGNKIVNCPKGENQSINTEWTGYFSELMDWVINTVENNDIETIKAELKNNRNKIHIPNDLKFKAKELGIVIQIANVKRYPVRLSNSFYIAMKKEPKNIICGNSKFNMQLKDVEGCINKRYEKYLRRE